jgi:hypothetical protein
LEASFEFGDAVEELAGDGGRHVVRRCTIEENGRSISMLESAFWRIGQKTRASRRKKGPESSCERCSRKLHLRLR